MHNNYHFLKHLSSNLKDVLVGSRLLECYSQNKDELVLVFLKPDNNFFHILANLGSDFSSLNFPKEYNKAKRNTATLFSEIAGAVVQNIIQKKNERAFSIHFHNGTFLIFKLFGNRANLILFQHQKLISVFKNSLKTDKTIDPSDLNREIDLTFKNFTDKNWSLKSVLFTLGALGEKYLQEQGYETKTDQEKFKLVNQFLTDIENPKFYLRKVNNRIVLALFEIGEPVSVYINAIEAVNAFYTAHFRFNHFQKLKELLFNKISENLNSTKSYLNKLNKRFEEVNDAVPYGQMADILMANLHLVPRAAIKVELFDFYRDKQIEIKLKKDLSPQKNAEQLYRKEKNRHIEVGNLQTQIDNKNNLLNKLNSDISKLETISDFRTLEILQNDYTKKTQEEAQAEPKFKTTEYFGFKIYIGRNAANNDELTHNFAHKEDMWLHAKDVSGSHVIIKYQAGKVFPKNVIERAAEYAAFYSKRKNESLCPVICTQKKYVRKIKGAAKGAVRIEKEKILMAKPGELLNG